MNCKTGSTMKKILSAALSLTVAVSASAVTLPSLISAGSIVVGAAAADVSINSTSVELYAMDDWANEYISIPSTYQTRFQLKVTGASDVTYSSNSQYVTVSDKGLIETKYALTYWYNQGGWSVGYGYPLEGQTPSRITKNINFNPATITVTADNRTFRVNVTLKDYVDVYVEKVLDDYVKSSIKPTMTTYEKCVKIAEFIAARNYDPHYASTAGLVVSGGADCWGSTETAIRLAKKAGLRSWVRNGNRDALAGSGHKNAIVYDGKEIYIIEAGYGGTAPRYWEVEKRNTFWSYRTASSGDGIELYQYDDETMPEVLTVPSSVDGKEVVGLGYNFISMSRNVKQVVLPDTLKYIGTNAFYGCSSLEKINFPAGLERIDERAFGECYSLKTVTSASSAFKYVGSVIYNGTTAISCPHGENVNLRSGTKVVGTGAFAYNSKLQSVTLPSSVETLEEGAFSQCYNFSSLKINSTKLKSIGSYALAYNKLTYILLPDSVTTISPHAFDTYSGNNADMLLVGKAGGAVETYAKDNGHSFLDSAKAVKNTSTVSAAIPRMFTTAIRDWNLLQSSALMRIISARWAMRLQKASALRMRSTGTSRRSFWWIRRSSAVSLTAKARSANRLISAANRLRSSVLWQSAPVLSRRSILSMITICTIRLPADRSSCRRMTGASASAMMNRRTASCRRSIPTA